jgi:hypothetical protein
MSETLSTTKPQRPEEVATWDSSSPPTASQRSYVGSIRSNLDTPIGDVPKEVDEAQPKKAIFRNVWHEIVFISVVTFAQFMTVSTSANEPFTW